MEYKGPAEATYVRTKKQRNFLTKTQTDAVARSYSDPKEFLFYNKDHVTSGYHPHITPTVNMLRLSACLMRAKFYFKAYEYGPLESRVYKWFHN